MPPPGNTEGTSPLWNIKGTGPHSEKLHLNLKFYSIQGVGFFPGRGSKFSREGLLIFQGGAPNFPGRGSKVSREGLQIFQGGAPNFPGRGSKNSREGLQIFPENPLPWRFPNTPLWLSRLLSEVFRILCVEVLGYSLDVVVNTNFNNTLDPDIQFGNISSCQTQL